jgi:hypothetical protein
MKTTDPAPVAEHSCERCGMRFWRRPQDSQLCLACRGRRDHARILAYGRARTWMAEQHQDLYAEVYERQVAQDPEASTTKIRNRARSRTLGELARQFPGDYRQRYAAELARAHAELAQAAIRAERPVPPPSPGSGPRPPRPAAPRRLRGPLRGRACPNSRGEPLGRWSRPCAGGT